MGEEGHCKQTCCLRMFSWGTLFIGIFLPPVSCLLHHKDTRIDEELVAWWLGGGDGVYAGSSWHLALLHCGFRLRLAR